MSLTDIVLNYPKAFILMIVLGWFCIYHVFRHIELVRCERVFRKAMHSDTEILSRITLKTGEHQASVSEIFGMVNALLLSDEVAEMRVKFGRTGVHKRVFKKAFARALRESPVMGMLGTQYLEFRELTDELSLDIRALFGVGNNIPFPINSEHILMLFRPLNPK